MPDERDDTTEQEEMEATPTITIAERQGDSKPTITIAERERTREEDGE